MWKQKIKVPSIETFYLLPLISSNFCKNSIKNNKTISFNYNKNNSIVNALTDYKYVDNPLSEYIYNKGVIINMRLIGNFSKYIKFNVNEYCEYFESNNDKSKFFHYNLVINDESTEIKIKLGNEEELRDNLFLYMNEDRVLELELIKKIIDENADKYAYIHK